MPTTAFMNQDHSARIHTNAEIVIKLGKTNEIYYRVSILVEQKCSSAFVRA